MVAADGKSSFAGAWAAGRRCGRGDLSTAAGYKFRGGWAADKPDGKGEATYADGSRFDGGFRDGRRDGRGTYEWPAGQQYLGHFAADAIDVAAPGTVVVPKTVPVGADEWIMPVAVVDLAKVHVKAGFSRSGQ